MKGKMKHDRIPRWRQSADAQWLAIQAHSLTLAPSATAGSGRAALWQTDIVRGTRFTECLDFLLKDVVKKHQNTVESLMRARGAPILATAIPAGNDWKLAQ